jgi:hypothetical protein
MDGMKNSFGSLVKRELVRLAIYIRIRSGFMYACGEIVQILLRCEQGEPIL